MSRKTRNVASLILFATMGALGCGRIRYEILALDGTDAGPTDAGPTDAAPIEAGAGAIDAAPPIDANSRDSGAAMDSGMDAQGPVCNTPLVWHTDFDRDPANDDNNQDGVADWSWMRSKPSPSQRFHDGAWYPVGVEILDTRPLRDWNTRTTLHVRMQNLSTDFTQPNPWGALVWMNLNNDKPSVMAVYLSLNHNQTGGQTLHFRRNGLVPDLITVEGLPDRLIEIRLDVDPVSAVGDLWVDDRFIGSAAIPDTGTASRDAYATVATFYGPSIFDSITFVSCK